MQNCSVLTHIAIVTDPQSACRLYTAGRITNFSLRVPSKRPTLLDTRIVWIPMNSSLPGNDVAHVACTLTYWAFPEGISHPSPNDTPTLQPLPSPTPICSPTTISPPFVPHRSFPSRTQRSGAAYTPTRSTTTNISTTYLQFLAPESTNTATPH